jgi:hypothetical protein
MNNGLALTITNSRKGSPKVVKEAKWCEKVFNQMITVLVLEWHKGCTDAKSTPAR